MWMEWRPDTKKPNKCFNLTFWYPTHILFVRNRQISDMVKRNTWKPVKISREYYYGPWEPNILNNNLDFDTITHDVLCVLYLHLNDSHSISFNLS